MTLMDAFFLFHPLLPDPWHCEVLTRHFHLNVNLKAVSLRLAWMLIYSESLFALDHVGYGKLWETNVAKPDNIRFFSVFCKEPLRVFFCSGFVRRLSTTLIFSHWQWLVLRPIGENKTLWICFGSWISLCSRLVDCWGRPSNSIAYFLLMIEWESFRRYVIILFITEAITVSRMHPFICTVVDKMTAIRCLSFVFNPRNGFSVLKQWSTINHTNLAVMTCFGFFIWSCPPRCVDFSLWEACWMLPFLHYSEMWWALHAEFISSAICHYSAASFPNILATTVTTHSFVFTFSLNTVCWYLTPHFPVIFSAMCKWLAQGPK